MNSWANESKKTQSFCFQLCGWQKFVPIKVTWTKQNWSTFIIAFSLTFSFESPNKKQIYFLQPLLIIFDLTGSKANKLWHAQKTACTFLWVPHKCSMEEAAFNNLETNENLLYVLSLSWAVNLERLLSTCCFWYVLLSC